MKLKVTVICLAFGLSCMALSPPPPPPFLAAENVPANAVSESSAPSASSEAQSPATDIPHGVDLVSIDFPNGVNLVDIIKTIGVWSGKNFLIAQGVLSNQKVSIIAPEPMTKEEAYQTFLSALNATGLTTVETGKIVKILSIATAKGANIKTYYGANWAPETDDIINQVIPLHFIDANTVINQLRPLFQTTPISAFTTTNSLVITDTGFRIKSLIEIIQLLDNPKDQPRVELVPINYMDAKDVNQKIKDVFGGGGGQFGGGGGSINLNKSFVDERTNSLILIGPARGLDDIVKFIKRIDTPLLVETAQALIRVRPLDYADSEKLATTLQAFTSSQAKTGAQTPYTVPRFPTQPYYGGNDPSQIQNQGTANTPAADLANVKIQSDKSTNSLIIQASKGAYNEIEGLIVALDKRRNQIYLEADILSLNIENDFTWNPSALGGSTLNGKRFFLPYGFNPLAASAYGLVQNGSSKDFQSILGAMANQFSLGILSNTEINIAGQKINPGAVLFALKTDSNTNVLQTPSMMVSDNETANFESSQAYQSVIQVANPNGTGFTQTPLNYNVTTMLKVKPHIARTDYVNLEIALQYDDAGPPNKDSGYPNPINKRKADSVLTVRSGQTAVMGGLIKEENIRREFKIPLLGDIPILGWLFKNVTNGKKKANLTLFLTPHVVKNSEDLAKIYEKKLKDRDEFLKIYYGKNFKKEDFYKILPTPEQGKAIPDTPVASNMENNSSGDMSSGSVGVSSVADSASSGASGVSAGASAVPSRGVNAGSSKAHEEIAGVREQILPSQNKDPIIAPPQNSTPPSVFSMPPPPPPPTVFASPQNSQMRAPRSSNFSAIPQVSPSPSLLMP